jgi:hypothetical protein
MHDVDEYDEQLVLMTRVLTVLMLEDDEEAILIISTIIIIKSKRHLHHHYRLYRSLPSFTALSSPSPYQRYQHSGRFSW